MEDLWELTLRLPDYLGGHILLSLAALGIGLAISIPLGIVVSRRPKLAESMLTVAGILQTVPTLALLALMVPILNGTIGFLPAFIALTLYSILPMLASTITGIRGIDPGLTEAARSLGMTDWQMLTRVQLPLAMPIIISGVRTATVLVVGTATLALPVGGLSLGNYIFAGLSMSNIPAVVFGCILTAVLAIFMDQLVHVVEVAVEKRSRRLAWVALAGFIGIGAFGAYDPIRRAVNAPPVVVASAPFTEQFILSELMRLLLVKDFQVDQRQAMYETIQFSALKRDKIDCCVNYTGNIWVTIMHEKETAPPDVMYDKIKKHMAKHNIEVAGKLGFQNNYVFIGGKKIREKKIQTIEDLAKHKGRFVIAGDEQFFNRPEWHAVRNKYGLEFAEIKQMDVSLIYGALDKQVDLICAYSSDGRIDRKTMTILEDKDKILPPYDAILLYSNKGKNNAELVKALEPLTRGQIDDKMMIAANLKVDVEKDGKRTSPRAAANEMFESLGWKN